MRPQRLFIFLASLYMYFYMGTTLSAKTFNPVLASPSEPQRWHVAIQHFSRSINRQCAIRKFLDIPPAIILDLADRFRESRSDHEIFAFDIYAKRYKDGSLVSCANKDGARCSADENIYAFYKVGEIENFSRFFCHNKNFLFMNL